MRVENLFLSVVLLNGFAYLTIKLRPKLYNVELFKPMIKNFKLSLLPFAVLLINFAIFIIFIFLDSNHSSLGYFPMIIFILGLIAWVLLLPNSGYLITELNLTHRNMDKNPVPIWYDIVSICAFALSGIVNTLANIVLIQLALLIFEDPKTVSRNWQILFFASAVILNILVSIGVYLGRSIRFNSWDILNVPKFVTMLWNHFKKEGEPRNFALFVFFHTIFFMIVYVMLGIPNYFVF